MIVCRRRLTVVTKHGVSTGGPSTAFCARHSSECRSKRSGGRLGVRRFSCRAPRTAQSAETPDDVATPSTSNTAIRHASLSSKIPSRNYQRGGRSSRNWPSVAAGVADVAVSARRLQAAVVADGAWWARGAAVSAKADGTQQSPKHDRISSWSPDSSGCRTSRSRHHFDPGVSAVEMCLQC